MLAAGPTTSRRELWGRFSPEAAVVPAPLDGLIERSLTNNPDVKAAQAALRAAWEQVRAYRGVYYPNVSARTLGPIIAKVMAKSACDRQPATDSRRSPGQSRLMAFCARLTVLVEPPRFRKI